MRRATHAAETGSAPSGLARKLGVKPEGRLLTRHAPAGFEVDGLPAACVPKRLTPRTKAAGRGDVTLAFFVALADLEAELPSLADAVFPDGALWAAWPRRAAGHASDIADAVVRATALRLGLVDVKVAAIGEDWSGLRLVWRRALRPV